MSSLKDLLTQIETLQNQVAEVRQKEVGEAIAKVRAMIDEYNSLPAMYFLVARPKAAPKRPAKSLPNTVTP